MTHFLWDWNGTLLDDTQAALDTLNIMLARRHGKPITMAYYRDHFAFPVKPFYEAIGVRLGDEDWDALAREYHDVYAEQPKGLNREAVVALERVKASGARQSIISALRQDLLEEITARLGVAKYMDRICGVDNLDGFGKVDRAREMLSSICASSTSPDPSSFVLVGDALHDKEVADALGVECVLCAQGSHSFERLAALGSQTAPTLVAAVELAVQAPLRWS